MTSSQPPGQVPTWTSWMPARAMVATQAALVAALRPMLGSGPPRLATLLEEAGL